MTIEPLPHRYHDPLLNLFSSEGVLNKQSSGLELYEGLMKGYY